MRLKRNTNRENMVLEWSPVAPHTWIMLKEVTLSTDTANVLFKHYEDNHTRADPEIPTNCFNNNNIMIYYVTSNPLR